MGGVDQHGCRTAADERCRVCVGQAQELAFRGEDRSLCRPGDNRWRVWYQERLTAHGLYKPNEGHRISVGPQRDLWCDGLVRGRDRLCDQQLVELFALQRDHYLPAFGGPASPAGEIGFCETHVDRRHGDTLWHTELE